MSETHYPSFAEVEQVLAPKIDALRRETVYAEYADPATQPIRYRSVVGEKGQSGISAASLTREHAQLLRAIFENQDAGVRFHIGRQGWGISKGYARLGQLKAAGCIVFKQVPSRSPFGGRGRLVPVLTPRGHELLQAYENQKSPA